MQQFGFQYFAQRDPETLAAIGPREERWTRGELARLVNSVARSLRARGLRKADRLAIVSPNCVEFIAVHMAATQIGLYVVPVNWHLGAQEIDYILADSRAAIVVIHQDICAAVLGALSAEVLRGVRVVCIGEHEGIESLRVLAQESSSDPLDEPETGTTLYYTSATTGRPKAVVKPLTDVAAALAHDLQVVARNSATTGVYPDSGRPYLCTSMLYHGAPLNGVLQTLHLGNPVVIMSGWSAKRILEQIERHRVATAFMVPAMFGRLLRLPPGVRNAFDLSSLVCIPHGGAPCPVEIKRQMIEWLGPILFESYGASEGGGTFVTSTEWLRHPGTVGRPFPGGGIRILDDEGNPVPPGVVGNIYLKSHNGSRFEYSGDPSKTDAAWRGDYFTVGDMGYVNEEGYLFICDRRTDMINSAGMKIYAAEIEQVLATHPVVRDCAVLGVQDPVLGEAAVAAVELEDFATPTGTLTAELLDFLLQRLGAMKVPKRIRYVEKVPRDPNGKLFKRLLKESLTAA
jgi:long-chain acyl-CoA synthetase